MSSPGICGFQLSTRLVELELEFLVTPNKALERALLAEPGLSAILRHMSMGGREAERSRALLDEMLGSVGAEELDAAALAIESWTNSAEELSGVVAHAQDYLPADTPMCGQIHVVIGYEMAAAAPPDILVNAAHPRFRRPEELRYLLIHEAHHLGFLHWRSWPDLHKLFEGSLAELVRFATQMEGMAVHAAYPLRQAEGALEADGDYAVYTDPELATRTIRAFGELWQECQTQNPQERTVEILEHMSSGERLWYRFGALVSARIEENRGRGALVETIREPEQFWRAAQELLEASG